MIFIASFIRFAFYIFTLIFTVKEILAIIYYIKARKLALKAIPEWTNTPFILEYKPFVVIDSTHVMGRKKMPTYIRTYFFCYIKGDFLTKRLSGPDFETRGLFNRAQPILRDFIRLNLHKILINNSFLGTTKYAIRLDSKYMTVDFYTNQPFYNDHDGIVRCDFFDDFHLFTV